jgi:leader peptidase (prepilin peptidase)/N-methyltransferase
MTTLGHRARLHTDGVGVAGVLSLAALLVFHWHQPALLLALVPVALVALEVARTDLATRRIPNRHVVVVAAVAIGAGLVAWLAGSSPWPTLGGVALAGGPVLLFHIASPAGMGFGDVKWAAALGGVVGLVGWSLALLVPLVGALLAVVMAALTRQRHVAFAPALSLGALFAVTLGPLWMGGAL